MRFEVAQAAYLENVGNGVLAIDLLLHDSILVNTHGGEEIENTLVHRLKTIDN